MSYQLPGEKSKALLDQGLPHLRDGLSYQRRAASSADKGFAPPAQMIVGRAEGDFVWDVDDNRYIDLQNGWATNPLGNCHPEIIEAVHQAHLQYGFQWEHPLRIPAAEKIASLIAKKTLIAFMRGGSPVVLDLFTTFSLFFPSLKISTLKFFGISLIAGIL